MADRFAWLSPRLRPGGSTQALRIPSRDGHPALRVSHDTRPPSSARPLVYASPLQGCGGAFTPQRKAPPGGQPQSQKKETGVVDSAGIRKGPCVIKKEEAPKILPPHPRAPRCA